MIPADDDGAQIEAIDASEAEELQEQAREALAADRAPVALGLIEQSLEQAPQSFDALSLKAKILVRLDRPAEALEAVDAALAIVPGDYDALAEKAGILSMYLDDLPQGLTFAKRAYAEMLAAVTPEERADRDGPDFWAVENVYDNLYYASYRLGLLDDAAKIRAEASSFGHEFAEGVEDD